MLLFGLSICRAKSRVCLIQQEGCALRGILMWFPNLSPSSGRTELQNYKRQSLHKLTHTVANPLIFPFAAFCFTLIDQLHAEKGDRLVKTKNECCSKKIKYLPSNLLCLETKVLRNSWLVSSTRFSKSCLLCWPNLSSISWVQHVVPWGHTRRCSPATQTENSASVLYLYQTLYVESISQVSYVSGTLIPDP